ncbi:hypothetical protein AMK59_2733, partial [Oryctes borbonicus]
LLIDIFFKGSTATDTSYRAAVVEYYPVQNFSASDAERAVENVKNYGDLIDGLQSLDIIVFPEWTITQGVSSAREKLAGISVKVPDNSEEATPCGNEAYPQFFQDLSCLAQTHAAYLVANLLEKESCNSSGCASDGWNFYNTNVVFDRKGRIILRYRKFNPFGEAEMNITKEAETATFTTDFDVTFGTFICFDILFEKPALELVRNGVKHIAFPTMWFSELPFLTALQSQEMFAIENDVVFLAAGANSETRGSGGSGIYQGSLGAVKYDIVSNDGNRVIVADVLKEWDSNTKLDYQGDADETTDVDVLAEALDGFTLLHDNLTEYHSYQMLVEEDSQSFEHDEMKCEVSWKMSNTSFPQYHYDYSLFYYSGVRSFSGVRNGGVDVCAVVFCKDQENPADCGTRYAQYNTIQWPYNIEELTIKANFTVSNSSIQFPNTLLSSIRPLNRSDYEWSSKYYEDGKIVERKITLLHPQNKLLVFGIYGRDFNRDGGYYEDGKIVERKITLLHPQNKLLVFGIYGRDFNRDGGSSVVSVNLFVVFISLALFYKLAV